jgi:hypothetical protein
MPLRLEIFEHLCTVKAEVVPMAIPIPRIVVPNEEVEEKAAETRVAKRFSHQSWAMQR